MTVQTLSASGISPGAARRRSAARDRADGRRAASPPAPFRAPADRPRRRRTGRSCAARRSAAPPPRRRRAPRCARLGRILLVDPGGAQRRADPALAIAAPAERGGAGGGEGAVVDIAERRHPLDQRLDRRLAAPRPAALAQLAGEIGARASRGSSHSARHRKARPVRAPPRRAAGGRFLSRARRHRHVCATVEPEYERASSPRAEAELEIRDRCGP